MCARPRGTRCLKDCGTEPFRAVLGFIGLKLIGSFAGFEIPTLDSLLLVLGK